MEASPTRTFLGVWLLLNFNALPVILPAQLHSKETRWLREIMSSNLHGCKLNTTALWSNEDARRVFLQPPHSRIFFCLDQANLIRNVFLNVKNDFF